MKFTYLYYLFGRRWPMLLLMLAGIVVAILRRKHHPRASLLTVAALALFVAQSLMFGTVFYLLPRLHDSGVSYASINNLYLVVEFCRDIVYAGVISLLVCAVLSQRNQTVDGMMK
jgi:hypothetical protein